MEVAFFIFFYTVGLKNPKSFLVMGPGQNLGGKKT